MAKRTAQCAQCGGEYITSRSDSRFCTTRCSYQARIGRPHRRACSDCGADISQRHYNAKFCPSCYETRPQLVHEANQKAKLPWHAKCKHCGDVFEQPKQQAFCNFQCVGKYIRCSQLASEIVKTCNGCGETFATKDNRRTECGTACRQWVRKYPTVLRVLDRECLHCGTPFRAETAARKYCRESSCAKSAGKIRRRGLLASAYVEDVSRAVLAKRDRWRCQLCGKKVDRTLRAPHPMSSSIDHIVPISAGGEHSYANTQLAHLGCNITKGHRTTQATQLALIG
jgi:hypothetical protein